jgi:hypothetical protein
MRHGKWRTILTLTILMTKTDSSQVACRAAAKVLSIQFARNPVDGDGMTMDQEHAQTVMVVVCGKIKRGFKST